MDEQTTAPLYEPPVLVKLGEFCEDTLSGGVDTIDTTISEQGGV